MTSAKTPGILLRFRDLVTEPGGNIEEHRRIIDELGFAWWGWWARSHEKVPKDDLAKLLVGRQHFPIILFDSGMMEFYYSKCSKIAVAPGDAGIASPDFRSTPHYYVRGSYPAWFKLHEDIKTIDRSAFTVTGRPTISETSADAAQSETHPLDIESLRDERPTLWLIDIEDGI